jgi:hypothetical protein
LDNYLHCVGGTTGVLTGVAVTGVAAASAYYYASRPTPEEPLVPLDKQCPILDVSHNEMLLNFNRTPTIEHLNGFAISSELSY